MFGINLICDLFQTLSNRGNIGCYPPKNIKACAIPSSVVSGPVIKSEILSWSPFFAASYRSVAANKPSLILLVDFLLNI